MPGAGSCGSRRANAYRKLDIHSRAELARLVAGS